MKRIKENISPDQFNNLMNHLRGDENIRASRKERLTTIFTILYLAGVRVNEVPQLTDTMLLQLIKDKKLIIKTHKTDSERILYITDQGQKVLKKVFKDLKATDTLLVRSERATEVLSKNSVIRDVNTYLKKVFGDDTRITSHSFRQTLITELAQSGVNTKFIQQLIGHKSSNSTLRYVKPSEVDIMDSLKGVR